VKTVGQCAIFWLAALSCVAASQSPPQPAGSKAEVAFASLAEPRYPPLARQARITGEVQIKLEIRKDGSVASAAVVSGHPMLTDAALSSAKQSRFECRHCQDDETPYVIVYSFQIAESPGWPCPENGGAPRVVQAGNRVTVTRDPAMVDPYFSNIGVRSAKCLYLWRCGLHWGGDDYRFYKVRSYKCLGLWNCARSLREPFATCRKLGRPILN
jgi:TonB family protein